MSDEQVVKFREYLAERIRLTADETLSYNALSNAVIESHIDTAAKRLALRLHAYIVGITRRRITVHERWPADWWQAVRERWCPAWVLRRWPVRYRYLDLDEPIFLAVCPHLQIEERDTHLNWMAQQDDEAQAGP